VLLASAIRDDAYTTSAHTRNGKDVQRGLRRGRPVHIFNDDVDLRALEEQVWQEGTFRGQVTRGDPARAGFDRFVWRSDTPIGTRIEAGQSGCAAALRRDQG